MEKVFVDSNNRIIHTSPNSRDGRKKVHYVIKRGPDGRFSRAYNRVAHHRKDGRNIANVMTVPKRIRPKRDENNNVKLPKYEVTMNSLFRWHKHLFEHFGWMILAKAKGYGYKVTKYKRSISEFVKAAEKLLSEYREDNRKHDIKVLWKQAKVLRRFSKML
jgi:hypothetical protein